VPAIDLLAGPDGTLSPWAQVCLFAFMAFPGGEKDESKRLQFITVNAVTFKVESASSQGESEIQLPTSWLKTLVASPPAAKVVSGAGAKARNAWMAGEVILFLINSAMHHPELEVTTTKAIWALPRLLNGEETYRGGRFSVGMRTVWEAWRVFKPVAHFWAVHRIWLQDKTRETGIDTAGFMQHLGGERLPDFLALSEVIRKAAVERKIVSHGETWRPPDSLTLPPARIDFPGLPQPALEELAKFRPEYAKDAGWDDD
jgi:hypothetical protein